MVHMLLVNRKETTTLGETARVQLEIFFCSPTCTPCKQNVTVDL